MIIDIAGGGLVQIKTILNMQGVRKVYKIRIQLAQNFQSFKLCEERLWRNLRVGQDLRDSLDTFDKRGRICANT